MAVSSDCKTFLAFHTIGLNYSVKYALLGKKIKIKGASKTLIRFVLLIKSA